MMIDAIVGENVVSIISLTLLVLFVIAAVMWYKYDCKDSNIPSMQCSYFLMYCTVLKILLYQNREGIPFLCLLLQFYCSACKLFEKEGINEYRILNRRAVILFKPETVEAILSNATEIEKSKNYCILEPWLGTGLLTSKGGKWRSRRKLLTPTFHFQILEEFLPVIDEQSRILVSKLKATNNKPWVNIVPLVTLCTLDIICHTSMGIEMDAQNTDNIGYVNCLHKVCEAILSRSCRPWLWRDAVYFNLPRGKTFKDNLKQVHDFTRKVIKERKQIMMDTSLQNEQAADMNCCVTPTKRRRAFLELLLECHLKDNSLTEEDIREEVDTIMFEGHDTTSVAISWALYLLGLHPEVQENVFKELDAIFEDDVTRHVTREDITSMKYLECVIKETLRLFPSVPFMGRKLKSDLKILDYQIPAGSDVIIFTYGLHRHPESFPNPEKFDPERFFPENSKNRHPYAYIPFSAGPRNCIGQRFALMEVKIILANVLRHLRVESLDQRDKIKLESNLTLYTADPLRLRFMARP